MSPPLPPSEEENIDSSSEDTFKPNPWLQKIAAWIGRRDYTEAELQHRLEHYGLSPRQCQWLIHRIKELGWLSDERVIESTLARKQTQWGKKRLRYYLEQRGISSAQIEAFTSTLDDDSEKQSAFLIWEKKFKGIPPTTPQEHQRQLRFLMTRGFSLSIAQTVLRSAKEKHENSD
jgi:regulatory protein